MPQTCAHSLSVFTVAITSFTPVVSVRALTHATREAS